jgi:tryptophan 2,3-dioxygenase
MDWKHFYAQMAGGTSLDYELYLQSAALLGCQKSFDELCNPDELQLQIVHQVEELWMKLLAYTLLGIDERLLERATHRAVTLPADSATYERVAGTPRSDVAEGISENPTATR